MSENFKFLLVSCVRKLPVSPNCETLKVRRESMSKNCNDPLGLYEMMKVIAILSPPGVSTHAIDYLQTTRVT